MYTHALLEELAPANHVNTPRILLGYAVRRRTTESLNLQMIYIKLNELCGTASCLDSVNQFWNSIHTLHQRHQDAVDKL